MDANATLSALKDALNAADWQEAYNHADALVGWLLKGGIIPTKLGESRDRAIKTAKRFRDEALRGTLSD